MIIEGYQYVQLISLVIAFCCIAGLRRFHLTAFIPLLIIINGIEIAAAYYYFFHQKNNYFIYNIYLVLGTPIQLYLYNQMLHLMDQALKVFWIISVLCMLLVLLNYLFVQKSGAFNTYSLILIMILNIIFSCLVLFRLSLQDLRELNLFQEPYFWINAVSLLFSMTTLVLLGLQEYIRANHIELANKSLYAAILPAANIVLYIGYSYAFLLCQTQKNR